MHPLGIINNLVLPTGDSDSQDEWDNGSQSFVSGPALAQYSYAHCIDQISAELGILVGSQKYVYFIPYINLGFNHPLFQGFHL